MKNLAALLVALSMGLASSMSHGAEVHGQLGKKVDDFSLQDFRGATHSLTDLKDAKVVVLAFLGVECPISKLYAPKLARLSKEYAAKGVRFVAVDSNRQDAVTEMGFFASANDLEFPFLKDLNNKLADAVGAARVPQMFVLDADRAIRYVGRVDDEYGFDTGSGYAKTRVNSSELVDAIDELLAGKSVSKPQTEAIGCLIGRVLTVQENSEVTYSKQIARIFQDRCVDCHRTGQIAPFALETYEDSAGWAEMIAEVVRDRRMPPWHPDPKFGHWKNDLSLSETEKQQIYSWVAAGAPQGDPKDLPAKKDFATAWMIDGGPDQIIYMTEEPVDVKPEGTEAYRYYTVDPGFTEDKWIVTAEAMPDNRAVVHHIIVSVVPPRPATAGAAADPIGPAQPVEVQGENRNIGRQALGNNLATFAPGMRPNVWGAGYAKLIPAGSRISFQMHYTPNGTAQKDRSSLGLKFCDAKDVTHRVVTSAASNAQFVIPAGDPNYKVESNRLYRKDVELISLFPHMHLRGKAFLYEMTYPDGTTETLMDVPRYDFNWQSNYMFTEPKRIPAGATLHCTAHFDNSAENPANPDPDHPVRWGDQTWEEMMIGWFDFAVPKDINPAEVLGAQPRRGAAANPPQEAAP